MTHRYVHPQFRSQGMAKIMFQAARNYVLLEANATRSKQSFSAKVWQLDVLVWLYNQGFRPLSSYDEQCLERVLYGDPGLFIGANNTICLKAGEDDFLRFEIGEEIYPIC